MKATCPTCSSCYRVGDEKIPDIGAQIKCPKCGTPFVVHRQKTDPSPLHSIPVKTAPITPEPALHEQATPLEMLSRTSGSPTPHLEALSGEAFVSTAPLSEIPKTDAALDRSRQARGVSAIRAQSGTANKNVASPPTKESREPVPSTPPIQAAQSQQAAVKTTAGGVLWAACMLSTLLVLFFLAATLTRYGISDFSDALPLKMFGVDPPPGLHAASKAKETTAGDLENPEQIFGKAMGEATQYMRSKRFSKAALEYNRALSVHPGSVDALEGLAKAYNALGDADRAQAALTKAKSIAEQK
jgi:predicted Zn finger-like uncharacterized protein